jgi:RecB family endonuclease NucS
MELSEFHELAESSVAARTALTAFVHCEITYSGRAEAFLSRGDRILMIKQDQTVIIHQPEGSVPINYMRPGSLITVEKADEHLMLRVKNDSEHSFLDVEIYRVHNAIAHRLEDGQKQDLAGNERDMSDWIRDNPACISSDFRPISREEQTDVGFIDVFGHDCTGRLVVVECKRITASLMAVDQLRRYVERVKQIKGTQSVTGVLAAPSITPNALEMLSSWGFRYCKVDPPKRLERWSKDQKKIFEF